MLVEKSGGILPKFLLGLLIVLLALSIFKNISYPLLWNDEAETAMFAKRILTFGYPKVHDGKNVLNLLELPDKSLAIDRRSDAYVVTVWGHFYFAVIGELLSRSTNDIYLKTALVRIPFAIAGFAALLIIALTGLPFFGDRKKGLYFLSAFFFLELISIPIILHMREVRYYSLALLLLSIIFYLYSRYAVLKTLGLSFYIPLLTISMLLLYNSFPPPFFACVAAIGLAEVIRFIKRRSVREFIEATFPLIMALLLVFPLLRFFHTLEISSAFALYFHISAFMQTGTISGIVLFLWRYEFLCVILFARLTALSLQQFIKPNFTGPGKGKIKRLVMNDSAQEEQKEAVRRMEVSNLLSLLFVLYILLASKIPLPVIYERYFIFLQPFLSIILLFDIFNIASLISQVQAVLARKYLRVILLIMAGLFVVYGFNKIALLKNHTYELFHQYKGPLDYAIPYIQSNYKDTENLTIATNYEECSLMYYLGSKVIIGYVGNNLKEDMTLTPDIIIFRKKWTYTSKSEIFAPFFAKARYKPVAFEVFDNAVNNIPQISGPINHLFKTKMAKTEKEALVLHIKY